MTRKTIVLLILVVILIVTVVDLKLNGFTVFMNFFEKTAPITKMSDREITPSTPRVTSVDEQEIDVTGISRLILLNPNGSIWITGEDETKITVKATYTVFARTEEVAKEYVQSLEINEIRATEQVQLGLNQPGKLPDDIFAVQADYVIRAPKSLALDLEGQGTVQVKDFQGSVNVKNLFGQVGIINIGDDVTVSQNSGPVQIEQVKGSLNLKTGYSNVVVKKIGGKFIFDANAGQVHFEDIEGSVTGVNSFGSIEGYRIADKIKLESRMGAIAIFNVAGDIQIRNEFADVVIDQFARNANITVKQGLIRLSPITENYRIKAETSYGSITIPEWPGIKVNREKSSGEELECMLGEGKYEINLRATFGDIILK